MCNSGATTLSVEEAGCSPPCYSPHPKKHASRRKDAFLRMLNLLQQNKTFRYVRLASSHIRHMKPSSAIKKNARVQPPPPPLAHKSASRKLGENLSNQAQHETVIARQKTSTLLAHTVTIENAVSYTHLTLPTIYSV